jgi:hypothetical protein
MLKGLTREKEGKKTFLYDANVLLGWDWGQTE